MQFGYGIGGGATAIESTRRRWVTILLAFLLGAALVLVTASPADAAHIGGHDKGTVSADYADCSVDVTFANTNSVGEHHFYDITSWGIREEGGGATLATLPLSQPTLGAGSSVTETASLPAGVYEAEAFAVYSALDTATGPVEETGIEVKSASFSVVCEDFSGPGFTGDIACEGDCTVAVNNEAGQDPDVTIDTTEPFKIVITTTGKGTPPGQASVLKVVTGETLPKCTGKNPTDCAQIKRVSGARTQYTVFFSVDPRFRFR